MTAEQRERAIIKNMQALKITRKEAEELVADDEAVDRGESLPWDLTPEQMKNARKMANATTRKSSGKATNAKKKENPDKQSIITCLHEALASMDGVESLTCTNAERTIDFTFNGISSTVSLTAHRK